MPIATCFQPPYRFTRALDVYLACVSYSAMVGVLPRLRATVAQSSNRSFKAILYPQPWRFSPHASRAFTYGPNSRRIRCLLSPIVLVNSSRHGTRPSSSVHFRIAAIISSLLTASPLVNVVWHRLGPVQARFWLAWVELPPAAGLVNFRVKEVQTPENTRTSS